MKFSYIYYIVPVDAELRNVACEQPFELPPWSEASLMQNHTIISFHFQIPIPQPIRVYALSPFIMNQPIISRSEDTTRMHTTQYCGFMRLPPEIRSEVYSYLLQFHSPWTRASPQILRTCRTIYQEASQLLYKLNTIPLIFEPNKLVLDRFRAYYISGVPSNLAISGMVQNSLISTTTLSPNNTEHSAILERCENLEVVLPIWLLCCQENYAFERVVMWLCKTLSANESFRSLKLIFDWRSPRSPTHIQDSDRTDSRGRYLIGILGAIRGLREVRGHPVSNRTRCP